VGQFDGWGGSGLCLGVWRIDEETRSLVAISKPVPLVLRPPADYLAQGGRVRRYSAQDGRVPACQVSGHVGRMYRVMSDSSWFGFWSAAAGLAGGLVAAGGVDGEGADQPGWSEDG
jgi:hypothetical protein